MYNGEMIFITIGFIITVIVGSIAFSQQQFVSDKKSSIFSDYELVFRRTVCHKPKLELAKPQINKVAFNEAKRALISLGYKSESIKELLKSIGPYNTAEEYIDKVMSMKKKE